MQLVYVSNARLPTERAHGVQIIRMCDAFASCGANVTLVHPWRRQTESALAQTRVREYYGAEQSFSIRTLRNVDVAWLAPILPRWAFLPISLAYELLRGWHNTRSVRGSGAALYFTREITTAWWLVRAGLPTALEIHTVPGRLQRKMLQSILGRPELRIIVAVTGHLRDDLVREVSVPRERTLVLHDGVDLRHFQCEASRDDCRRLLGLPTDRPIVLYAGQLNRERGVYGLLGAAGRIPEAEFVVVGGREPDLSEFTAEARGLPNVKLVGQVEPHRVPGYLHAADVLVLPQSGGSAHYLYYASPMKLFEYMAARRPIVATALPCIQEVLEHGETALLVPPEDDQALSGAIRRLLEDHELARSTADRAAAVVRQYTWAERARSILAAAHPSSAERPAAASRT